MILFIVTQEELRLNRRRGTEAQALIFSMTTYMSDLLDEMRQMARTEMRLTSKISRPEEPDLSLRKKRKTSCLLANCKQTKMLYL